MGQENPNIPSSLTIYIPNSLSFYLLEKEKLFEEDIFVKFWKYWAESHKVSLEFIITDSPSLLKRELVDNHLSIVSDQLPAPSLEGNSLFSSSVIENNLTLLEINPVEEPISIGLLEKNYIKFLESPYFPLLKEEIKIFKTLKDLLFALSSHQITAILDYPFLTWEYPIEYMDTNFSLLINEPLLLNDSNIEVISTLESIEESFEEIEDSILRELLKNQKNFFSYQKPPTLLIGLNPNYHPFSYWEEEELKGLFADQADLFFSSLGVPYKLVNIEKEIPSQIDILWGSTPKKEDSELSFYRTSFSLFSLKEDFNKIETPNVSYEKRNEDFIAWFSEENNKNFIWKENNLPLYGETIDAWLIETPRIPLEWIDNIGPLFYKNILLEKNIYFSLEPNDKLRNYFNNNILTLWKDISLSQWNNLEKYWINKKNINPYKTSYKDFVLDELDKLWLYNNSNLRVGIDINGSIIEKADNFLKQSLVDVILEELSEKLKINFTIVYASGEEKLKELLTENKIDLYFDYNKEGMNFINFDTLSIEILKIPLYFYTIKSQIVKEEKDIFKSSIGVWDKIITNSNINLNFKEVHSFPHYNKAMLSLLSKNTNWILMDPFNSSFFAHKFSKTKLYPIKINEPIHVSLYLHTSNNKKNLYHLLEKSFFSYTPFEKELLLESWKNKLIQSPSIFYNFLILLPLLITLLLLLSINYNFFTRKLKQGESLNKKLKEAEKTAREANAIKSEFIANVSHELRTSLNGIIGTTEILKNTTTLTKNQKEYFSILEYSSHSLLTIINDLLDVSRIENKRIHLENKPFLLIPYLKNLIDNIKQINDNSKINILLRTFNLPNEMILGDPIRLTQILNNLIRNSIKFTETGFVKISVSSFKRQYKKVWIEFRIEDTGIGIAQDKLINLFKPFTQAHDTLSIDKGGIGLGLYICQSLVSLMEGNPIEVRSQEGKGSSFSFTIPFQLTNLYQEESKEEEDSFLLILLENPFEESNFLKLLKNKNMSFKITSNPHEALNLLSYSHFKFFILEESFLKEDSNLFLEINKNLLPEGKIIILGKDSKIFHKMTKNPLLTNNVFLFDSSLEDPKILVEYLSNIQEELNSKGKETLYFKDTHILMVEDHAINQKILTIMLSQVGIESDIAKTGKEAIDKFLLNKPYDLIFMDIQLPDKNGFEITKEIREIEVKENKRKIPIISITANAMHGYKNLCIERGLDDYLSKPILMENLIEILKNWLPIEKQIKKPHPLMDENSKKREEEENSIPYLNLDNILKNLNLSMEEYETILIKTYDSCYDKLFIPIYQISQERKEEEKEELAKLLHGLSGVLGNIGSLELFKELKNYEKWILEKKNFPPTDLIEEILFKLKIFFNSIKKLKKEN